jgi:hypothetical protein
MGSLCNKYMFTPSPANPSTVFFVFFVAVMHCAEMQNALNEIESLKKERNELNDKVEAYEKSLEVMCTIKTTDLEEEEERE